MTQRPLRHSQASLAAMLGFREDGGAVVDSANSIMGAIGPNAASNLFSSANIVASATGSVLQRLAYLQSLQTNTGQAAYAEQVASKVVAGTSLTTGASPFTLFTVTGTVLARVWAFVTTGLTSTSNNGTLAIGVTGATAAFIAATTVDGTNFPTGAVWAGDTAPTLKAKVLSAGALTGVLCASNVIATIATNSLTAGSITFFCEWRPVSAGATVV